MRKALSLILALVLCLSLSACGKSEAVKNVEAMIDALGEITLESIDAIRSAEDAYNALTEDEQKKVDNYETLTQARDSYYELALAGEWVRNHINISDVASNYEAISIVLNSDMTGIHQEDGNNPLTWSVVNSQLCLDMGHYQNTYNIIEENGIIYFHYYEKEMPQENITWQSDSDYLSVSDFHTYLDDIFLIVDLSSVELSEYFDFTVYEEDITDEWGDSLGAGYKSVLLKNKLYEQGWMFLDKKDDYAIEVLYPAYTVTVDYKNGNTEIINHEEGSYTVDWYTPYTCYWQTRDYLDSYSTDSTATSSLTLDQLSFGRARGTFIFINSDYVVAVQKMDAEITNNRILTIEINGITQTAQNSEWVDGVEY